MSLRKLPKLKKGLSAKSSVPYSSSNDLPDLYVGVDLSLTDTGFSIIDSLDNVILAASFKTKASQLDFTRCRSIADHILDKLAGYSDHKVHVFIEAMPFARKPTGKSFTRTEALGMLKYGLALENIDTYMVGATTLKKRFANNGKAQKDEIQAAVYNRFHRLVKNENTCDALGLAALGADYLTRGLKFTIEKLPR